MKILAHIAPYLSYIPILIGIWQWGYLRTPFRIFVIIISLGSLLGVISSSVSNSNFLFYLNPLLCVGIYGLFFRHILLGVVQPWFIWVAVAIIWATIGGYVMVNGVSHFQTQILIAFDLFMLVFCGIYLSHCLQTVVKVRTPLFFLCLTLFVNFCFVLFVDLISVFLYRYFSNNFFDVLWDHVIPVVNVLKVIVFSIILWRAKDRYGRIDNIPDF